jgi:transposase
VKPPTQDEEAVRDLTRSRDDAQRDLTRARNRLSKFMLRRGIVYAVNRKPTWSQKYRSWLRALAFERTADQVIFEDYLLAVEQTEARLAALVDRIECFAEESPWRERVQALRCFHGINTVTAMALVAEIHDPRRFAHPRRLMSYLGLVPREYSSGMRERRGGITGAGNRHVRRLLVEAAWHYRHKPVVGRALRLRRSAPAAHAPSGQAPEPRQHRHRPRTGRLCVERPPHERVSAGLKKTDGAKCGHQGQARSGAPAIPVCHVTASR